MHRRSSNWSWKSINGRRRESPVTGIARHLGAFEHSAGQHHTRFCCCRSNMCLCLGLGLCLSLRGSHYSQRSRAPDMESRQIQLHCCPTEPCACPGPLLADGLKIGTPDYRSRLVPPSSSTAIREIPPLPQAPSCTPRFPMLPTCSDRFSIPPYPA
jgi:hypothetical protein